MNKIESMLLAGRVNQHAIEYGFEVAKPGVTLKEIDKEIEWYIRSNQNCKPAFLNYTPDGSLKPFPNTACISPNDVAVHGIPGDYVIKNGDLITIDVGTECNGWFVDAARSKVIGNPSDDKAQYLILAAEAILKAELSVIKNECTLLEIVEVAELTAKQYNVTILPQYGGHQIGEQIHMSPFIPNAIYRPQSVLRTDLEINRYRQTKLFEGQTICIEPVVTYGSIDTIVDGDNWTVRKADGNLVAHTERCLLITKNGYELLS